MTNEQIKRYITRQLDEQEKILSLAMQSNGKEHQKRDFFFRIEKHVESFLKKGEPRWISIPGLRGVGKTTILAQLFFHYTQKFNNRVLYVSLDEVVNKMGGNLFEVLDAYEALLGESFHSLKDNVLLLIDEAHFDPKWQDALKILYDQSRKVFVVSTGSSAIAINRNPEAARRVRPEKMRPLRFTEYITLSNGVESQKELGDKIFKALLGSSNADEVYSELKSLENEVRTYWKKVDKKSIEKYIQYHSLPSTLPYKTPTEIYQILNRTIDRVVQGDFISIHAFSPTILSKIPSLLKIVASSDESSMTGLAGDMQDIDKKTLISVFQALEDAELLLRVHPFSSSSQKRARKPSKYLFLAPSLRAALIHLDDPNAVLGKHKGKLLEDAVILHLYNHITDRSLSFGYDNTKGGADLIINSGTKKVTVEVGWNKSTIDQVLKTMERTQGKYGLVITDAPILEKKQNVVTVPFEYFFLL